MKPLHTALFTTYLHIDWADTKHDIYMQAAQDSRHEFNLIPHQISSIDDWAIALHKRFGDPSPSP